MAHGPLLFRGLGADPSAHWKLRPSLFGGSGWVPGHIIDAPVELTEVLADSL
jgi:hypothetical protein